LVDALQTIQAANGEINVRSPIMTGKRATASASPHTTPRADDSSITTRAERSLLAKENNAAGVDAQPEEHRWSVTRPELERVVFAAFAFPNQWARVQGWGF
jgi:hypothetical protein